MFRSKKDGLSFIFTEVISAITNNLKDGMGLKMKNVNIMGVHWKIWFLVEGGGGSRKSNI